MFIVLTRTFRLIDDGWQPPADTKYPQMSSRHGIIYTCLLSLLNIAYIYILLRQVGSQGSAERWRLKAHPANEAVITPEKYNEINAGEMRLHSRADYPAITEEEHPANWPGPGAITYRRFLKFHIRRRYCVNKMGKVKSHYR